MQRTVTERNGHGPKSAGLTPGGITVNSDGDNNDVRPQRGGDNPDYPEEVEVGPGGLLAGSITGANMSSSSTGNMGGGPVGGFAAGEVADEDDDGGDIADIMPGSDAGVSDRQSESEAGELNG